MTTPTVDTLTQWMANQGLTLTPEQAARAPRALHAATLLITTYLKHCRPLNQAGDTQAVSDATCAQATLWLANNITPLSEHVQAAGKIVHSSTLLGASMTMADTGQARVQQREQAALTLCEEALLYLRAQNITPLHPSVVG